MNFYRSIIGLVFFVCTGFAQSTVSQQTFDAAYWAAQPTPVAALSKMAVDYGGGTAASGRTNTAISLATQGYTIDNAIDVWGQDAYFEMLERQQYGYTWVPSLLQPPVQMAPGLTMPGYQPYNPANPPSGSIKVSLNLADYPPFNPPAPPPAPAPVSQPTSCVGISLGAGFFQALTGTACSSLSNGQLYTADPRGTFTYHTSVSPFAPNGTSWFTEN